MLIVLSPAKKLDFESDWPHGTEQMPVLINETESLIERARQFKAADLMRMMGISESLAELNVKRFQAFSAPFTSANARPALDAFKGDVYVGLDAPSLDEGDRSFANRHIRILSGLYGVLRPLDLMQAYRLEMGTHFPTDRGETLYQFWGEQIAQTLTADITGEPTLVNLASAEYFKSVDKKALGSNIHIITPVFREVRDGQSRVIAFFAKRARGAMARYAIDNRITEAEGLKGFNYSGYSFDADQSTDSQWIFSRPQPN